MHEPDNTQYEKYVRMKSLLNYDPYYDMFSEIDFSRFSADEQNIILETTENAIRYLIERKNIDEK